MSFKQVELNRIIQPAKTERAGKELFPILSMTMKNGLVDQADKFKKRIASADTSQYKVVKRNQLVVGFPIDEGVLSFQELYDKAIVSPAYDIWDLRNEFQVEPRYLQRFLRSPAALAFYVSKLRGTTARRRTLPDDIFLSLNVPLPAITEQRRIVNVLEKTEALQLQRSEAIETINELIEAIHIEMFESKHKYPEAKLSEVCEFITKGTTPKANDISAEFQDGLVPFLKVMHIDDGGGISFEGNPSFVSREMHAGFLARSKVLPGDVLMNIVGPPLGKIGLVPPTFLEWNVNQAIAIFRPTNRIRSVYLLHTLRNPTRLRKIISMASGIRQLNLSLEQCRNIVIPIPPVSVQDEFAHRVLAIHTHLTKLNQSNVALDEFSLAIQSKAFMGEL